MILKADVDQTCLSSSSYSPHSLYPRSLPPTVSLWPSLARYHRQWLTLLGKDGSASWNLTKVGTEEGRMGVDREIKILEERLAGGGVGD